MLLFYLINYFDKWKLFFLHAKKSRNLQYDFLLIYQIQSGTCRLVKWPILPSERVTVRWIEVRISIKNCHTNWMLHTFEYKVTPIAFTQIIFMSTLISIYKLEFFIICCWIQSVSTFISFHKIKNISILWNIRSHDD